LRTVLSGDTAEEPGRELKQMLDGDTVVHERQILAQKLTGPELERQRADRDKRGEALDTAGRCELRVDRVGNLMRAVGLSECPRLASDTSHAGETLCRNGGEATTPRRAALRSSSLSS
jgi:hypothetical protein